MALDVFGFSTPLMNELEIVRRFAAELLDQRNHLSVRQIADGIGDDAGIYAIHLLADDSIPSSFAAHLVRRKHRCLYIGETRNGKRRLVRYDLSGQGPSTFFCSLGLVLGYSPLPGSLCGRKDQGNFKFCDTDTDRISAWSLKNLTVTWRALSESVVDALEAPVIEFVKPLLNLKHNPCCLEELEALRRGALLVSRTPVAGSGSPNTVCSRRQPERS